MNKTKKDILSKCNSGNFVFVDAHKVVLVDENSVYKAMDEYAKQESIEFRRFCQAEYKQIMVGLLDNLDKDFDTLAYELYLQSKTNNNG